MKRHARIILFGVLALLPVSAPAASPPGILNHQGRIVVGGTNYGSPTPVPGYFKFALVAGDPVTETHWTNDDTNTGSPGGTPTAGVPVTVSQGHYAVGLGDTAFHANMNNAIGSEVFAQNADLRLRVWFSADDVSYEQLMPDRRITSAGYALAAGKAETLAGLWTSGGNSGSRSSAFGMATTASGDDSIAAGWNTMAVGARATAFGNGAVASGADSIAAGWNTEASEDRSTAFGFETEASGTNATAFGNRTAASWWQSTAFGDRTEARGRNATAFGLFAEATWDQSTAFGFGARATERNATAFGRETIASGEQSTAFGFRAIATNRNATAFGLDTVASGNQATAFGLEAVASADQATAFGRETVAPSYAETAFGTFNTEYVPASIVGFDPADRLLVVGNGTGTPLPTEPPSVHRSDALVVWKNGDVEIGGDLLVPGLALFTGNADFTEDVFFANDVFFDGDVEIAGALTGSLDGGNLSPGTVAGAALADGAVGSAQVADGSVLAQDLWQYADWETVGSTVEVADPAGAAADRFGHSVAALGGNRFVVGAPFDDPGGIFDAGSVHVYQVDASLGLVTLVATVQAPDASANDGFGSSVAALGANRFVVGSPRDGDAGINSGSAYVFEVDVEASTVSQLAKVVALDGDSNDQFGSSVAGMGANRFVVGSPLDDDVGNGSGSAYVFEVNGINDVSVLAKVVALDANNGDEFGSSVAGMGANRFVVGSPLDDGVPNDSGSAYVFEVDVEASTVSQLAKVVATDEQSNDRFGSSVAGMGANRFVVGSPLDDGVPNDSGSAYVFEVDVEASTVSQLAKVVATDEQSNDRFGSSVAGMGANRFVVGSPLDDGVLNDSGSAYVFEVGESGNSSQLIKLEATGAGSGDRFGSAVAGMDADRVVVGAPFANPGGLSDAGAVHLFLGGGDRYAHDLIAGAVRTGGVSTTMLADGSVTAAKLAPGSVDDADADPANELNTSAALNGTNLELTDAGGTLSADLSSLVNDADASPTNELQTLSQAGSTVTLSGGGGSVSIDDADADPANELQTLSLATNDLTLSNGGGTVNLSGVGPWAATGANIERTTGYVGIAAVPNSRLHVDGDGATPSLRVQVSGGSKLTVGANGGTTIGAFLDTPPANGLYVAGAVGIGTPSPSAQLSVNGAANNNTGVWGVFSDRRLKEGITPLEAGSLERLLKLEGMSYEYVRADLRNGYPHRQRGWVAQEVEKVFPEWVREAPDGMKMVTPVGFNALAVEALRELREEKDGAIAELRSENEELEQRLERIEKAIAALAK